MTTSRFMETTADGRYHCNLLDILIIWHAFLFNLNFQLPNLHLILTDLNLCYH